MVKSIVAIDGPRVRFAADALLLLLPGRLSLLKGIDPPSQVKAGDVVMLSGREVCEFDVAQETECQVSP